MYRRANFIKGIQYNIPTKDFNVTILKKEQNLELYIRPYDVSKNARMYHRDLTELNYTNEQFTAEMEYLFELLKDEELIQFIYNFLEKTNFSLGMAFVAYSKNETEREEYIEFLKKNHTPNIKIFEGKNG